MSQWTQCLLFICIMLPYLPVIIYNRSQINQEIIKRIYLRSINRIQYEKTKQFYFSHLCNAIEADIPFGARLFPMESGFRRPEAVGSIENKSWLCVDFMDPGEITR